LILKPQITSKKFNSFIRISEVDSPYSGHLTRLADDIEIQNAFEKKRKNKIQKSLRLTQKSLMHMTPDKENSSSYYDFESAGGTLTIEDLGNTDFSNKSTSFFNVMDVTKLIDIKDDQGALPPSAMPSTIKVAKKTKTHFRFSGAKKRGFGFNNLGKRNFTDGNRVKFNDLSAAIMNGTVTWDQLMFNKNHLSYINKNKEVLLRDKKLKE